MEITQELLHELFEYRNGVLYWKIKRPNGIQIGDKAGSIDRHGYLITGFFGKRCLNHRIIFLMIKGYLPKYLDHIDGNPLNNCITNLREASLSQNSYNTKRNCRNTTGVKSVYWNKVNKKYGVRIRTNSGRKFFGYFEDLELAELVATEARNKYHGEFANHGKQDEKVST